MATEIKMNPEELRGQAARLAKISNRMQDITNKTQGAMSAMVGAVSPGLVMNLDWKGKMLLTGLESLTKSLQLGEQTAINAANALEDTDKNIGKKPSEIIGNIWNTVTNTTENNGINRQTTSRLSSIEQYGGVNYQVLDYRNYIMSQYSYDGSVFGYGVNGNVGCTATAWCMGKSILTGQTYDPTSSTYWNPAIGANYVGYKATNTAPITNNMYVLHDELQSGKPCFLYAQTPYRWDNKPVNHACMVVGVAENADHNNLTTADFLVVDPAGGVVKKLSEMNYECLDSWSTVITYRDDLVE